MSEEIGKYDTVDLLEEARKDVARLEPSLDASEMSLKELTERIAALKQELNEPLPKLEDLPVWVKDGDQPVHRGLWLSREEAKRKRRCEEFGMDEPSAGKGAYDPKEGPVSAS